METEARMIACHTASAGSKTPRKQLAAKAVEHVTDVLSKTDQNRVINKKRDRSIEEHDDAANKRAAPPFHDMLEAVDSSDRWAKIVRQIDEKTLSSNTTNEAIAHQRLRRTIRDLANNTVLQQSFRPCDGTRPQALMKYANGLMEKARELQMVAIEMKQEQADRLAFKLPLVLEKLLDKPARGQLRSPESAQNAAAYAMGLILRRTDARDTYLKKWKPGFHCDCHQEEITDNAGGRAVKGKGNF